VTKVRTFVVAAGLAMVLVVAGACGGDDEEAGGGGGASTGAEIFSTSCATCHGQDGEGGYGPQLGGGAVAETFPDIEDQIAVITNGRANMPAFEGQLSPEQIRTVAEYEREELGQ